MSRRPRRPGFLHRLVRVRSDAAPEGDEVVRTRSAVRVVWLGLFVGAGFAGLSVQAARLMLLADPQLETKARVQFESAVEIEGRRGDILDRHGEILATTVELYSLHADPSRLDEESIAALVEALPGLIEAEPAWLQQQLSRSNRRDVRLARGVTPVVVDEVKDLVRRGVVWARPAPTRFYPARGDAVQVIGLTGAAGNGVAGVERTMDRVLRGSTFKYVQWRDRKGRRLTPEVPRAQPGESVVLTLDRRIQRIAEEALDETMERTGALSAHATVVDVSTGDVLAIASRPTLNPNDTSVVDMQHLKNHAVMDTFEPGSVFKPMIAAAAMEEGLVGFDSLVDCEGGRWRVGRKTITDDHPHTEITLAEVIKYSSNIGAAKLAFELGAEDTLAYLVDFGIARDPGLDLPGETRGLMRDPESIRPIELATTAYGHGVTASGLQLASAFAALGNDGLRMQPRLVSEVRDSAGRVVESFPPEEDRQVVSPDVAHDVVRMMEMVTEDGGTGKMARVPGYRVAGKTGTAWKVVDGAYSPTDRIGSWVGLIPAGDPVLSIAVTVDTPSIGSRYGGPAAGPGFVQIAAGAMRVLGIPHDPPDYEEPAEVVAAPSALLVESAQDRSVVWAGPGTLLAPDLRGMSLRDLLSMAESAGLAMNLSGSGRVVDQLPRPGEPVAPGDTVRAVLQ